MCSSIFPATRMFNMEKHLMKLRNVLKKYSPERKTPNGSNCILRMRVICVRCASRRLLCPTNANLSQRQNEGERFLRSVLLLFSSHCTHRMQLLYVTFFEHISTYMDSAEATKLRGKLGQRLTTKHKETLVDISFPKAMTVQTTINYRCLSYG
jgi:hypothetical protein